MNRNTRILIIDDNEAIHEDFRKILTPPVMKADALHALEDALFGDAPAESAGPKYHLTSAFQGHEGFEIATAAEQRGEPYAVAFVDVRMPPGWDGVETARRLRAASPRLHVVICTAYSDYSLDRIEEQLGTEGRLQVLRKPFDPIEVEAIADTLVNAWNGTA